MKQLHEGNDEFKAIKEEWLKGAHSATIDTLPAFLRDLTENYSHDYGTICHVIAIAAIAAAWAVDHSPQGGITGFQAGCIMWEFIRNWNYSSNKTGLRLIDYDNFLYPQYEDRYQKTISKDTWEAIQKEAKANLLRANGEYAEYLQKVEQYKEDIAAFVEKYPDYYERREYYDPLGMGNAAQWEAEEKKRVSGFEFAPQEPFCPVHDDSPVYHHWLSIVNGEVPFGYSIELHP